MTREVVPFKSKPFTRGSENAVRLMIRHGHFMCIYYTMNWQEVPVDCVYVPAAGTNGATVWINPAFWAVLSREQRMTLCAHEMGHKMYLHNTRRGARDHDTYNRAGDHRINNDLLVSGFAPLTNIKLADGHIFNWCCDPKYKDGSWTTERIYDDLVQQGGGGGGGGLGPMRDLVDYGQQPDGGKDAQASNESSEAFEQRVRKELKEMALQARLAGKQSAWMHRAVEQADAVKVPWHQVLEQYLRSLHKADYAWNRWNKREFVKCGIIAPDMYLPAMGHVGLFIDVSGSCWPYLGKFNQHMRDIWDQVRPEAVHVRYFQTHVNHEYDETFERGQGDVVVRGLGGGGTSFSWLADEVEAFDEELDCVLVLTDMEADFGRPVHSVPVLWCSVSGRDEAPFGETIFID